MDIERIRAFRFADPFKAFVLLLKDGRRLIVDKPYYLAISPKRDLLLVVTESDSAVWFSPDHVQDVVALDSVAAT